jgi:Ca2+-binding RTX toxin-like protein
VGFTVNLTAATGANGWSVSNAGNGTGVSLTGSAKDDTLVGGSGNDTLSGGLGADQLTGGMGADIFRFTRTADSSVAASDQILDFSRSDHDLIDVSLIDANTALAGDQAFTLVAGAFTKVAGQISISTSGNRQTVGFDVNGDGTADFQIYVLGAAALAATDFIL